MQRARVQSQVGELRLPHARRYSQKIEKKKVEEKKNIMKNKRKIVTIPKLILWEKLWHRVN